MSFGLSGTLKGKGAEVFSLRFMPNSGLLLAAQSNGTVLLYDWKAQREVKQLTLQPEKKKSPPPVMCLAFQMDGPGRNALLAVCSDGFVSQWDVNKGKCMASFMEEGNEVYAVDCSRDGSHFCTGGMDRRLRVYGDTANGVPVLELGTGDEPPHGNRISAVAWSRKEAAILASSSWDNSVKVWDVREPRHPVRNIVGPSVTGDGLDMFGGSILTGSARPHDQIEVWDIGSGQREQLLKWPVADDPVHIYACRFSKNGKHIVAGGAWSQEVLVFSRETGLELGGLRTMKRSAYCAEFGPDHGTAAVAGADGNVYLLGFGAARKPTPKKAEGNVTPGKKATPKKAA